MSNQLIRLKTGEDDAGRRLDRILRKALPDHSLSLIHRLLRQGKIRVDDKPARPETRVLSGSVIQIAARTDPQKRSDPSCQHPRAVLPPLPDVLAKGSGIVFFNKPAGLASHGAGSLDAIVKAHHAARRSSAPSISFKPGPLHRLDRPTSGVIAFSESLAGAKLFTELLRERRIAKTYLAIVEGRVPTNGELIWKDVLVRDKSARKTFIGADESAPNSMGSPRESPAPPKIATTIIRVLASGDCHTLIEARIATGRTHQIRAQAAAHGHPLAGDVKYGGRRMAGGFLLHAWKIEFDRDIDDLPRSISAPPPEPFMASISSLFGRSPPGISQEP